MRPGLARMPQFRRLRGRQGERERGEARREGSIPPREGSTPSVGGWVVSSGKTKSPSSELFESIPSPSAGRFTIRGSMSETESVDIDSGVTGELDTDVDASVEVVGGRVVVEVGGRTGAIGSPTPATAAS